jgi:hypothetical protein
MAMVEQCADDEGNLDVEKLHRVLHGEEELPPV